MQLKRSFLNYRSLFWRNAEAGFLIGPIAKLSDSLRGDAQTPLKRRRSCLAPAICRARLIVAGG
jgi:hypothetical protein